MKKFFLSCVLFSTILNAQFTFKGKIDHYEDKRIVVKINQSIEDFMVGNLVTNQEGYFSIPIKQNYTGIISLTLLDAQTTFSFLADNTNIDFKATIQNNKFIVIDGGNDINRKYLAFDNYNVKNQQVLPSLQAITSLYNPSDEFYIPLRKEIDNIKNLKKPEDSNNEYLNFYIDANKFVQDTTPVESNTANAESVKNQIIEYFKNAPEYLENSGLIKSLLYNYIIYSTLNASSRSDTEKKLENSLDILLDEVGEDTSRGQAVLANAINLLNTYGIENLAKKYNDKVSSLTCEISPELKALIDKNNNIKEGKIIPNLEFTHVIDNKYKSLYDIKNNYKLVLVWASWCSHCKEELPNLKTFYETFKAKGGEIIGFSVDYNKEEWQKVVKDLPWINDSDFLYWDSKFAKTLNITGTPTFFLLDKNNKILKISAKVSELSNFIK